MNLMLAAATWFQPDWARCLESWDWPILIVPRMDVVPAYQFAFQSFESSPTDVIGYIHDDLICHERDWNVRIIREFEDPEVALVGVAGATGHGQPWMYDQSFHIPNMVRIDFRSNMVNAEQHGTRLPGVMNAAVLDGMALFIRKNFLWSMAGWPLGSPVNYFMYTEWLCCMVRRANKKIRVVGLNVEHLGGRSSGLNPYFRADFEGEHRYIYDNFRDVFPARVIP